MYFGLDQMSTGRIWMSRVMVDSTLTKAFRPDEAICSSEKIIDTQKRNLAGEPLSEKFFPTELHGKYHDYVFTNNLPDIFTAGPYWIVSESLADVFRQFDLGEGALYPVKVLQHDRKTPVEGTYFHLNFGNIKDAFLPEHSLKPRKIYSHSDIWRVPGVPKDGDVAVRATALKGADIWLDPKLRGGLFLSDRLVQALREAKLTRRFGLSRCKVMHDN